MALALIRALGWYKPIDRAWFRRHDLRLSYLEAVANAMDEWARVRRDDDRDG